MRLGKVLHSLGSQPVPMSGVLHKTSMPASGNMLEVEEQQHPGSSILRLQKANRFSSNAPSQR